MCSQSSIHHFTGLLRGQHNDQPPVGLLALLVQHCTGVAEVMGSNPLQAWQKSQKLTVLCSLRLCENGLTDSERSIIFTLMFNQCKTLFENGSCKINVHFLCAVRTANAGNHYVFLHLQTLTFKENACFQPQTPVNTLLYTGKMPMNQRKTSCLRCVNRAVNAGK